MKGCEVRLFIAGHFGAEDSRSIELLNAVEPTEAGRTCIVCDNAMWIVDAIICILVEQDLSKTINADTLVCFVEELKGEYSVSCSKLKTYFVSNGKLSERLRRKKPPHANASGRPASIFFY